MASPRKVRPRLRLYLDACALQRPFDRLTSAEDRAEVADVLLLLSWSLSSHVDLVWSTVLEYEVIKRAPLERRAWGMFARGIAGQVFRPDPPQHARARDLAKRLRLGAFDALHLACAEALGSTLVTVDHAFLARTAGASKLRVEVLHPTQAVVQVRLAIKKD
jgi:predicted nucleic acid-binding protein